MSGTIWLFRCFARCEEGWTASIIGTMSVSSRRIHRESPPSGLLAHCPNTRERPFTKNTSSPTNAPDITPHHYHHRHRFIFHAPRGDLTDATARNIGRVLRPRSRITRLRDGALLGSTPAAGQVPTGLMGRGHDMRAGVANNNLADDRPAARRAQRAQTHDQRLSPLRGRGPCTGRSSCTARCSPRHPI